MCMLEMPRRATGLKGDRQLNFDQNFVALDLFNILFHWDILTAFGWGSEILHRDYYLLLLLLDTCTNEYQCSGEDVKSQSP